MKFMMGFDLEVAQPWNLRRWVSALRMGHSDLLGRLAPIISYFAYKNVNHTLFTWIGVTVFILNTSGYIEAVITSYAQRDAVIGSLQTLLI